MVDNNQPPSRDQIVLEYLNGGVTYRQLQAKYGFNRATINNWVHQHQGIFRDRRGEYQKQKSAKKALTQQPTKSQPVAQVVAPPSEPPNPLADQLREAQLTIALLEEVIRIAQQEQGLILPKKSTTKR